MCGGAPPPPPPPPPPPQLAKAPSSELGTSLRRRRRGRVGRGQRSTLLTGTSGIDDSSLNTGKSILAP